MTDIRRTTLLAHPLNATPDRVAAIFVAFYLRDGDQPLIRPNPVRRTFPS